LDHPLLPCMHGPRTCIIYRIELSIDLVLRDENKTAGSRKTKDPPASF
jgi:hypothetical protein